MRLANIDAEAATYCLRDDKLRRGSRCQVEWVASRETGRAADDAGRDKRANRSTGFGWKMALTSEKRSLLLRFAGSPVCGVGLQSLIHASCHELASAASQTRVLCRGKVGTSKGYNGSHHALTLPKTELRRQPGGYSRLWHYFQYRQVMAVLFNIITNVREKRFT